MDLLLGPFLLIMDYFFINNELWPKPTNAIRRVAEPVLAVKHGRVGGALAYTQLAT